MRPLVTDQYEIFCGIRHNIVYEKLEEFLKKLSQIAELIFFSGKFLAWLSSKICLGTFFNLRWSNFGNKAANMDGKTKQSVWEVTMDNGKN